MTEESNETARSFLDDMLGSPAADVKTPEAAPVVEAPAPEEKVVATETPVEQVVKAPVEEAVPAVAEKPRKKIREAAPAVDYERLAATTAKAVAEAIRPAAASPEAVAEGPESIEIPDSERRRILYLSRLEKNDPKKYQGLSGKYEKSYREVTKYQKDWEKANPGEVFDSEATEHSEFLNDRVVDWDDDDYSEAVADEKIAQVKVEARAEQMAQEHRRTLEPVAYKSAMDIARSVLEELDPLLKGSDLDASLMSKAEALDPIRGPIVASATRFAAKFISTSNRLFAGIEKYDAANPEHVSVEKFAKDKEEILAALPKGQQLDGEGRPFVRPAEYYKLDKQGRDKAWTLQAEELAFLARQEIVEDAKNFISREEQRADRLKKHWGVGAQKPSPEPASEVAPDTTPDAPKPISPSGGLDPKLAGVKGDPSDERSIQWNSFRNSLLGVK